MDLDGDVRLDSVWRTPDGKWIKATETLLASTGRSYSVNRRTHRYGYQNGVLVADTISSRGANSYQGLDTTWQDTLRYSWENGRIIRYTAPRTPSGWNGPPPASQFDSSTAVGSKPLPTKEA
ncbi:MAG: hypothetical protein IPN71_09670 [Fibrobacteres bacterium]|nr:hypothetical protein [Fibrobacterota bacterium]